MDLPVVCTLTNEELRERRLNVIEPIRRSVTKSDELPDGYAYTFTPHADLLFQLARLVDLERQCCQFLTFRIIANHESIRLEVTGTSNVKSVIANFFGSTLENRGTETAEPGS